MIYCDKDKINLLIIAEELKNIFLQVISFFFIKMNEQKYEIEKRRKN